MGEYVYSVRTKAIRALVNGKQRNVYPYKYSYKPYSGYRGYHGFNPENQLEARAEHSLRKILKRETNSDDMIYVCFGDPVSVDTLVYQCHRTRVRATIYDNYFAISEPVGYLYRYKMGKKKPWVVAMEQTLLP